MTEEQLEVLKEEVTKLGQDLEKLGEVEEALQNQQALLTTKLLENKISFAVPQFDDKELNTLEVLRELTNTRAYIKEVQTIRHGTVTKLNEAHAKLLEAAKEEEDDANNS